MGVVRVLVKWTIVIIIAVFCIQYWLHHKAYLFSIESVAAIAERYVGRDPEKAYPQIAADFRRKFPGHVLPAEDTHWMFMNAGGWMGSMYLLHASLTEYVLFFGSAVNTSGHSGRYWATISDTVLTGKFTQWKEGSLTVEVFRPGDTVVHEMGEATCVNFAEGTWMVEYGRGFIPSTLGFALADTLFSTQDFVTLYYILRVYAKAIMQETMFYLMELRHSLKESL